MKSTTQKVRSLSLSGYLGSDLASGSIACCRPGFRYLVPVSTISCSCYGLECCCHCCLSLFPVSPMSCSCLVLLCVDFPCYCVANSYTVLSLSCCCLVLILFLLYSFFSFAARNTISTAIMGKKICIKCTLTLRIYPLRTGE